MIDTHCHLTYDGLYERVDEVLAAARADGVDRMITVGTTPADAMKAVALAEKYPQVYATVGLHPHYSLQWDLDEVAAAIRTLSAHPKVVAIGEMGLDRHYPEPPIDAQKKAFEMQLALVRELDAEAQAVVRPPLPPRERAGVRVDTSRFSPTCDATNPTHFLKPIIIHNREATDETIAMIRASGIPGERFVFHCFTGTSAELDKILDLGAMVSFTGITTFKSAAAIAACAVRMPADRIMIETDSPYLTPEPHRKLRPNEPRYVALVAQFLAAKRGLSVEEFVTQVDANAVRFFGLPIGDNRG